MGGDSGEGGNLVRVSAIKLTDGLSGKLKPDPDGCGCGWGVGGVPSGEGGRAAGLGVRVRRLGGVLELEFCDI